MMRIVLFSHRIQNRKALSFVYQNLDSKCDLEAFNSNVYLGRYNARNLVSSSNHVFQKVVNEKKLEILPAEKYMKLPIMSVYLNEKSNILSINFGSSDTLNYPVVWLRDNCQCQMCFDTISKSRTHPPLTFIDDVIPKTIQSNGRTVSIMWGDGHQSVFNKNWLCQHSFEIEHQRERTNKSEIQKILWNSNTFRKNLQKISFLFRDIMNDDKCLLKWLETLTAFGVTRITDAPLETGQLSLLAKRIGFIRKTHYGEEYVIRSYENANNVAYQRGPLQLHTDLPYYHYVPGVVSLHCINNSSEGGENILIDSFYAVRQLSDKMYHILADTVVDWSDIDCETNMNFHSIYKAPVLCRDYFGRLERVNWSQPQRDSVFNVSVTEALEWYEAFQEFSKILHDKSNSVTIKSSQGDIIVFDNTRIIHGRTNYTDSKRFLCGAYFDWDEIHSKIRVLRKNLLLK